MKIYVTKDNLLTGVQIVQRAVSSKNPLPILAGILLEVKNNFIKFTATDLEIGIECKIPVTVMEEGSVVLNAKYFAEIVRKLPDTKIEITVNKNNYQTTIKYGQSEVSINGMTPEDYPILPQIEKQNLFQLSGILLKNLIRQVTFATSQDHNRPVFNGALLEVENNQLRLVATDTHRLAYKQVSIPDQANTDIKVIIPGKTLSELSKVINDEAAVFITVSENQILFEAEDIILISRLIEGQFPNYRQVIPNDFKSKIRLRTKNLLEAGERAALLARDGSSVIRIEIEEYKLIIESNSPEIGKIHEEIPIHLDGDPNYISLNSKYLLDVLKVIDSEEIYFDLSGALSPGVIKEIDSDDYKYLILPVRTV